ncbi:hypothetical protein [Spongiimicrobium sp. 3-5]|uniref:hypothetical protein n=1 Tax=Spongiimicrobium sp. 3-5 TaxID=3332596 RepID=UPI003980EE1E
MRPYLYLIPILLLCVLWGSCRKDFDYPPSIGRLEFSRDTVFLDTVFTNIGSSTYTLKVYNRTGDDFNIPEVRLADGQASSYRLNVDGIAGKEFTDIPILARDSLFIFVETTFDISQTSENEFLHTDAIEFNSVGSQQLVQLVTLVKDAVFLFPNEAPDGSKETISLGLDEEGNEIRVEGFTLSGTALNFTNEKPYVIFGYAEVPNGEVLTVDAGSRVHFHKNSGIYVAEGGTVRINGLLSSDTLLLENEVIFEGDRLEPEFSDTPGQWGTIWLANGSGPHEINYLSILNATVGLLVEGQTAVAPPNLIIRNSKIYNSANINLWARTAVINGENLVLGNAGNASLYCNLGGNYSFVHSTIANYWNNGFRSGSALQIDNFGTTGMAADLSGANFINCVVDGNNNLELSLRSNGANTFNFNFTNCLVKFDDNRGQFTTDPFYDFGNTSLYNTIVLNGTTDFVDRINNDFRIGPLSDAIGNAEINTALLVPLDVLGTDRTISPDVGAYQFIPDR